MSNVKQSAKYLFLSTLFSKGISFIGSIILAKLLFPEDYGYLLIAMVFTGFIQILVSVGFETYYLQETIESEEHERIILNVTYYLRFILNTLLFIFQIIVSYWVEDYYDEEIIGSLLRIFALNYLLIAVGQINTFILRKKILFKPEATSNLVRDIVGMIFKVTFAFMGLGALSFAFGTVIANIAKLFVILHYQKFVPSRIEWDPKLFKKIWHFGIHSFIGGIGMFFSTYIDKMFIASFFSKDTIGYYYFAHSQAQQFSAYLIQPQSSLVLSYSATYKTVVDMLKDNLLRIAYLISAFSIPVLTFLFIYADVFFNMIFGDKWDASVPLFQLFIVDSVILITTFPLSSILTAFGKPELNSKIIVYRFIFLAVILGVAGYVKSTIFIYGLSFIILSMIFTLIKSHISMKNLNSSLWVYLKNIRFPFILMLLNGLLFVGLKANIGNNYISVGSSIVASIFLNVLMTKLFDYKRFLEVLGLILNSNNKIYKTLHKFN